MTVINLQLSLVSRLPVLARCRGCDGEVVTLPSLCQNINLWPVSPGSQTDGKINSWECGLLFLRNNFICILMARRRESSGRNGEQNREEKHWYSSRLIPQQTPLSPISTLAPQLPHLLPPPAPPTHSTINLPPGWHTNGYRCSRPTSVEGQSWHKHQQQTWARSYRGTTNRNN